MLQEEWLSEDAQPDITVIDVATAEVVGSVNAVGTILRGLAVAPDNAQLYVALSHSNNSGSGINADSRPHSHALAMVSLTEGADWKVTGEIDLDEQATSTGPAPSPHSMLWSEDGSTLHVTLSAGQAILALDATTHEEKARAPADSDPRGLIRAQGRLWTYSWLNNTLQGYDLPLQNGVAPAISIPVGDDPTPADVKAGQRTFNDASFSRHGDFSCNNCHPDGLTDGLVEHSARR
jgi:DNA-binding beta-propeller fold protein YncE